MMTPERVIAFVAGAFAVVARLGSGIAWVEANVSPTAAALAAIGLFRHLVFRRASASAHA